jgi:hypothetical protein
MHVRSATAMFAARRMLLQERCAADRNYEVHPVNIRLFALDE